ncbi:MAG: LLM class flavin-dependent oxidoreductase [Alphaproteobacteria bacterium]|nr:MAG: LLM class flavin-dependent oxidoreductase [Alphaproteobacteria bacterium]
MSDKVNFGIWCDFRNPEPWAVPYEPFYRDALDQIAAAEGMGFDSVWLTEHHYCDDGYTPSPLVIAAAIASRTEKMRIGTNLIVLPVHDPIRLAEDAATLSILSGGRFDLGVGIGYRQMEFDQAGRQLKHRPSLIEESIEILRRAWTGEPINFSGKRFEIGDIRVTPAPPNPPKIFIGGMAPPAIDRAARIGDGFLSTGGLGHDDYVASLASNNTADDQAGIYAGCWAIIAADPEAEAARLGDYILYQSNEYISWGAFGPPEETPLFDDAKSAIENGLYELWDADMAVEKLSAMIETYPQIKDIHFWSRFPGESIESGTQRLSYIASEVLPRLR